MSAAGTLLEREEEFASIASALAAAARSEGAVLVVEGLPGVGKTSLCNWARARACSAGMVSMHASGSFMERDFSYGVVRQLLAPCLARHASTRGEPPLLDVPPAVAAVVGDEGDGDDVATPDHLQAVLHGLFQLTRRLAGDRPLLVTVDDAHWADVASLRFLAYLARRVAGRPVAVLVAGRSGDAGSPPSPLAEYALTSGVRTLRPRPLSEAAITRLVTERLGSCDPAFARACHQATAGIPYFVVELLGTLAHDGVAPDAEVTERVCRVRPATLAHATLLRLARLGPAATAVARAVTVLGPRAHTGRLARLTGLATEDVLAAVDDLVAAAILAPGPPVRFAHPILEACVYEELPLGWRDRAHRAAAKLLAAEGADVEEVAAHLMATSEGAAGDLRDGLRAAVVRSLRRGAPESAAAYLRRLLVEASTPEERAAALHELGRAEALLRDPGAEEHLWAALDVAPEPRLRAAIVCDLVDVLGSAGRWEQRIPLVGQAIAWLGEEASDLRFELERRQAGLEAYDTRHVAAFRRRHPDRRRLVDEGGPQARALALLLAAVAAWQGRDRTDVDSLLAAGLDGGRFLAEHGSGAPSLSQAVGALVLTDRLDEAGALVEEMFADARRRGSASGQVQAHTCRAWVRTQVGDLAGAEADMRAATAVTLETGDFLATVCTLRFGLEALLERPGTADLAETTVGLEVSPGWQSTLTACFLLEARGRLLLERGERDAGIAELRAAAQIYGELGFASPLATVWRPALALALGGPEAEELTVAELACAVATRLPRAVGRALRVAGLVKGGPEGLELLHRAVDESSRCPSRLEQARSLVDLGAALRRSGQAVSSRRPLAAGLELATACGADRLASRAREELRLAGGRARRRPLTGPGALTPAEERVACLAARGLSNEEIARTLFVSAKTVENQLTQIYRKLGVDGRRRLRRAIDCQPAV